MTETEAKDPDRLLLDQYAVDGSEAAFSELVRRHVDLVWSAAWRVTGDADLARDIAQTVFTDLARKARFLPSASSVTGWLYRASVLAARNAVRTNQRRNRREKEAMQLSPPSDSSDSAAAERLVPLLDEGLQSLNSNDREIVVLRFFARKSLADIGHLHAISEDAAQKRVSRALEKLKSFFDRRGQAASAAVILASLTSAGSVAAPASITTALVGASYVSLAAGAGWGSSLSSFIAGTTEQILIMKTPIAIASLVTIAVSVPLLIQHRTIAALEQRLPIVDPPAAIASDSSQNQLAADWARHLRDRAELDRLRAEAASLKGSHPADPAALQRLVAARNKLQAAKASAKQANDTIEANQLRIRTINAMKNLGLAARIFASDNQDRFPKSFDQITNVIGEIGLPLDNFEFVEHEREFDESEPQLLLFREKQPRKQPDGKWQRTYGLADGSAHTIDQDTPDYTEWESKWIARKK